MDALCKRVPSHVEQKKTRKIGNESRCSKLPLKAANLSLHLEAIFDGELLQVFALKVAQAQTVGIKAYLPAPIQVE